MTPQCIIVNECLLLLKQSEMQPIKKLRIEIQLMHLKRLLLQEDFTDGAYEDTLREVLSDIRKIRKGEHDTDTVSSLMGRMGSMLTLPGSNSEGTGKAAGAVSVLTALHSLAGV